MSEAATGPSSAIIAAMSDLWRLRPPGPDNILAHPAFERLREACRDGYQSWSSPPMRRSRQSTNGRQDNLGPTGDSKALDLGGRIPFAQRVTCTITDACEAMGLGRTKIYELIGDGRLIATSVGRRRLVVVASLLTLMKTNRSRTGHAQLTEKRLQRRFFPVDPDDAIARYPAQL
jgi:excisionase family DNA binding protein